MSVTALTNFSKYAGMISNSGGDERGKIRGGQAGDQTGKEWWIRTWYNRPWNVVIRFKDRKIANMLATISIYAAENNKIGYDQSQRTTYWTQLVKAGYDPRKITTACESDCSAGVLANVRAALMLTGHKNWAERVNINGYTGNELSILRNCGAGVNVYYAKAYLTGTMYLLPGDILLNEGAHTAVNLGKGSKMLESAVTGSQSAPEKPVSVTVDTNKVKCVKALQRALNASYGLSLAIDGDYGPNTKSAVDKHYLYYRKPKTIVNSHVKWLQENLNTLGASLVTDSSFGPATEKAVTAFQKKYKLITDGYAGVQTHTKIISLM